MVKLYTFKSPFHYFQSRFSSYFKQVASYTCCRRYRANLLGKLLLSKYFRQAAPVANVRPEQRIWLHGRRLRVMERGIGRRSLRIMYDVGDAGKGREGWFLVVAVAGQCHGCRRPLFVPSKVQQQSELTQKSLPDLEGSLAIHWFGFVFHIVVTRRNNI